MLFHVQDPKILDLNADSSQVRLQLEELQISVDEMQAQAATYTSYQKRFKVLYFFCFYI